MKYIDWRTELSKDDELLLLHTYTFYRTHTPFPEYAADQINPTADR